MRNASIGGSLLSMQMLLAYAENQSCSLIRSLASFTL